MAKLPVLVALDFQQEQTALDLADRLSPQQCRLKVGKELFTRCGPQLVEKLQDRGFEIFLDLKFHDIPNTVAGAVRAAAQLGVWMLNVHASGGRRMMEAAAEAAQSVPKPPILIAVTVLTSMSQEDLVELGYRDTAQERVLSLAKLAKTSGLDGVVCSAQEAQSLRHALGPDFCLVTPGIRVAGDDAGDQRRVVGPRQAIDQGADYLVIGRPITQADDPLAVLARVQRELTALD